MALVKRIAVDGEDVDIRDLTDAGLSHAVLTAESDLVALSLYEGVSGIGGPNFSETEQYRRGRLVMVKVRLKSLLLEVKRRKLEIY